MCLLVLAWNTHPRYRLVVAANRDEYHDRPTAALGRWSAPDDVLGGRDLRAGGTWLGIDRRRRFGIVTNFRDLVRTRPEAPSRGGLIPRYLRGAADPGGLGLCTLPAQRFGADALSPALAGVEAPGHVPPRWATVQRELRRL